MKGTPRLRRTADRDSALSPMQNEVWRRRLDGVRVFVRTISTNGVEFGIAGRHATQRISVATFLRDFDVVLANKDYADCTRERVGALIRRYRRRFSGARVLELGSHTGEFTEAIARLAKTVTGLENNRKCVRVLRRRLLHYSNASVLFGDVHRALFELSPGDFEIVVCCGLIYHSAHPFLVLEGIARLRPIRVLIDTLNIGVPRDGAVVVPTVVNAINFRYNEQPDCGRSIVLGDQSIIDAMTALGYRLEMRVPKRSVTIDPQRDSLYFRRWKASFSAWFKLTGGRL